MANLLAPIDFLKALTAQSKYWVGGTLVFGLPLFSEKFTEFAKMEKFMELHGHTFGMAFTICFVVVFLRIISIPLSIIWEHTSQWFWIKFKSIPHLKQLTNDEKNILNGYIGKGTKTQRLPLGSGVVGELESKFIIRKGSSYSSSNDHWHYNIQPWAWEYLNKHKGLLKSSSI